MNMNLASIYKITNKINEKSYIGVTKQNPPEERWYRHTNQKQRDQQRTKILYRAFDKYGIDNFTFEVIYQSLDHDHCRTVMEPYFIKLYESFWETGKGYNATLGGEGQWGLRFTDESRKKMSESAIKRGLGGLAIAIKNNTGSKHTIEHRTKISSGVNQYFSTHSGPWQGKEFTAEHKAALSAARLGSHPKKETVDKIRLKNSQVWEVTFPDNHKETIVNLREFCRKQKIRTENLWKTSKGIIKKSEGYSAKKIIDIIPFSE